MRGDTKPAAFSPAWVKEWWLGEGLACPDHLSSRFRDAMAERQFRELRFLAVMGLVLGLSSLIIDAFVSPDSFWKIAAIRVIPTVPLQLLAIALPRNYLGWQKFLVGASLCVFAVGLVYASAFASPGPSILMALSPVIVLGIAIPLLPYSKSELAIFLFFYCVPVGAALVGRGLDPDFTFTALIVLAIVAVGAAAIGLRLRRLERHGKLATLLAEERSRDLEESNARLTQLSMQDPLTSLANRRWTETAFTRDFSATLEEAPGYTALLLLDLDHFKEFNDQWGHDIGDRCLKAVAEILRHAASAHCGLASRIGGEEFVVLIRAFDRAEALALAEEVRVGIERIEIRLSERVESCSISTSIGVAIHEGHDAPELSIMLKRADEALYEAKRDGRNRHKLAA